MKTMIAPLACLGLLAVAGTAAEAAAPAYCALYAREYANQFTAAAGQPEGAEQRIQDEAYYRCLNQDQEPELPATSAYAWTELDAGARGGPFEPLVRKPDSTTTASIPASAGAADGADPVPPKPVAGAAPKRTYHGSGLTAWSPEWKAWCHAHFPNSFDENTGTVVPPNSPRIFCR